MLELVFVIAVIGILAVAIIPRMDRDVLYEATEQVIRDIRYTQHMAMTDDVYDADKQFWYYERWKIDFSTANTYTVSKGDAAGHFTDHNVTARDPLSHAAIDGTEDFDLDNKYKVTFPNSGILFFDMMGRPYHVNPAADPLRPTSNLLKTDFTLVLKDSSDKNATITVAPETGYVTVKYQ